MKNDLDHGLVLGIQNSKNPTFITTTSGARAGEEADGNTGKSRFQILKTHLLCSE